MVNKRCLYGLTVLILTLMIVMHVVASGASMYAQGPAESKAEEMKAGEEEETMLSTPGPRQAATSGGGASGGGTPGGDGTSETLTSTRHNVE